MTNKTAAFCMACAALAAAFLTDFLHGDDVARLQIENARLRARIEVCTPILQRMPYPCGHTIVCG